jgi:putative transferase (TIGR04331 family)
MEAALILLVVGEDDATIAEYFDSFVGIDYERDCLPVEYEFTPFRYRWLDDDQRKQDYLYLKNIYPLALEALTKVLNKIHQVDYDCRMWELAFGPWLSSALSASFDRYTLVGTAIEAANKSICLATPSEDLCPPLDTANFISLSSSSDNWNRLLIASAGHYAYSSYFKSVPLEEKTSRASGPGQSYGGGWKRRALKRRALIGLRSLFWFFARLLIRLIARQSKLPVLVAHNTYFSFKEELRLTWAVRCNMFVRSFKRPNFRLDGVNSTLRDRLTREISESKYPVRDDFLSFFLHVVPNILPCTFLELFKPITDAAIECNGIPRVSMTANAHWYDDTFKLWLARSASLGTKVILSEHGGSFKALDYHFDFEQRSSDIFISGWPSSSDKELQLPLSTFIGRNPLRPNFVGTQLLIISYTGSKWAIRAASHPQSYRALSVVQTCTEFLSDIKLIKKSLITIKVQDSMLLWKRLEAEYLRLMTLGYGLKLDSLERNLKQAKFVVCLYPQTAYMDAFLSGRPTILLFDEAISGVDQQSQTLLQKMRENGMCFSDAKVASRFVEEVWDYPDTWWNSESIREVRSEIAKYMMVCTDRPINTWASFLRGIL